MSAMAIDTDVSTVLSTLRSETESSELIHIIYQLEDFYERKLWNQLTLALEELYSFPESKENAFRAKIFTQFLSTFQKNLNPIKIVDFLLQSFEAPQDCLDQLETLKSSMVAELTKKLSSRKLENMDELINNEECIVYVNLQIARYSLILDNLSHAEEILESLTTKFESTLQNDYSSKVNAAFYLTRCQYYKIHKNYNKFYTNGLLYLSSIETPLSPEEKEAFCYDLCVSALLGDKIYNFGELILHDILNSISSSESQYFWLYELIQHLNAGDLAKFGQRMAECKEKTPLLAHHQAFLHQKIVIMSMLELISVKSTTNKSLSFKEISSVTGTPEDEVEFLIIKCFSLNLIKGSINQIDQVLMVTWLQPRILNLDQVKTLYNHLVDWDSRVEKLAEDVHKNGGSIWAGV
ncbi:putative 26S proteasome regulatory subunit [Clavispora lusitaniae]|uniref:26S proteasome regulatory subunit n=1 Tax=Clavispora lusitaniae TaxID=36911 RepID=A0ACD0WJ94_CLALS|nr:putative 26S proteasome regulatory subunit [Clavispora lusitaniae]QFZ33281.1 putative 26S proteasome regulatory subunit [Clavispora lusitaniae]QFZ38952.1 putative 26S proteasome regulatory subunit [Clavispora lusitaniae]QFZ44634.1 putative 26S proteasome regulatory subunit [Clavispora lusitaniae]QFZ50311.1 putative 26S proteasome regulatory subunit [Clavispora lusitaniae]